MKKVKLFFLFFFFLVLSYLLCKPAFAVKYLDPIEGYLNRFYPQIVPDINPFAEMVNTIVSTAIGLLTIIGGGMFMVMFFLGGVGWLSSSGNPEKIDKAKRQLTNSAVGLMIVVAAYGLSFIIGVMLNINVLNPGEYIISLGPANISAKIEGLAQKYYPSLVPGGLSSTQDQALTAGAKLNLIFSIVIGGITLFAAIFFIVYFLLGALQWLTSGGMQERLEKAKKQITAAVIGMIIVVATYSITFIVSSVLGLKILNMGEVIVTFFDTNYTPPPTTNCINVHGVCDPNPDNLPCCDYNNQPVYCSPRGRCEEI